MNNNDKTIMNEYGKIGDYMCGSKGKSINGNEWNANILNQIPSSHMPPSIQELVPNSDQSPRAPLMRRPRRMAMAVLLHR
jgi:hypothetical protein